MGAGRPASGCRAASHKAVEVSGQEGRRQLHRGVPVRGLDLEANPPCLEAPNLVAALRVRLGGHARVHAPVVGGEHAGARLGLPVSGFASGFISSSATIGAMGARARKDPSIRRPAVAGAVLSTLATVVQLVLVVGATDRHALREIGPSMAVAGVAAAGYGLVFGLRALRHDGENAIARGRAFEPRTAVLFALAVGAILFALAMAIGLFVLAPFLVAQLIPAIKEDPVSFALFEGIVRVAILVLYIWAVSRSKDVKRVFEYHGAEHKTVHAYEAGVELTVNEVRKYSRIHPRCGTSFLFITMIAAIVVFIIVSWIWQLGFWQKLLVRILFIPVIASISYEFMRFTAKHLDNPLFRALAWPGMLLQRLTTAEPDDDQLEVAIVSLKSAVGALETEVK